MKKLFYVQPIFASYRSELVRAFVSKFDVYVLADMESSSAKGFNKGDLADAKSIQAPSVSLAGGALFWQRGLIGAVLKVRPDIIVSFANPRYLSFWISLLLAKALRIQFYAHGQGLYAYPNPSKWRKTSYKLMVALSRGYICYSELSARTLVAIGCDIKKISVAENSIIIDDLVQPEEKSFNEDGILFVGRLREGSGLERLIDTVARLRSSGHLLQIHIIGGGPLEAQFRLKYKSAEWLHWYGAIFKNSMIAQISMQCRIGCYPGDAGLSVVHYFALSLPPLIHSSIHEHMGPEPSYVHDGKNGFLFDKTEAKSLERKLLDIWSFGPDQMRSVATNASETYHELNTPPLGDRFLKSIL